MISFKATRKFYGTSDWYRCRWTTAYCQKLIINVLPWTNAEYEQLWGVFIDKVPIFAVKVVIPKTYAGLMESSGLIVRRSGNACFTREHSQMQL